MSDSDIALVYTPEGGEEVRRRPRPGFTYELVKHQRTGEIYVLLRVSTNPNTGATEVIGATPEPISDPGPEWFNDPLTIDDDWGSPHVEWAPHVLFMALQAVFGRAPTLVTGDRGLHSPDNERIAREAGVRHLVIPRAGPVTPAQRQREQERGWRRRSRWRAGIEGPISSLRRD